MRARTRFLLAMLTILTMVCCVLLPAAAPRATESDPLVSRLAAKLDKLGSLKGRFVQSLDSRSLGHPRREEGRFCVKKPSFMRWDYEKPEEKLALLDGKVSWLYIPADREAYRGMEADAERASAPALLLAGRVRLDADFKSRRLSEKESGPQGVDGAVAVELVPLRPTEEFERIVVGIDPDRLQIRMLTVIDSLGGRMIFEFSDLEENPELAESLFHFEAPAGVKIIENQ